jgi:micrococcal nuclease
MRRNQDSEKHLRITRFVISSILTPLIIAISAYGQNFIVKKVIDGDTLLLTNGEYVRLIGVDTPETKHPEKPVEYFGEEAYRFTKRMVEEKEVRLEYDQTRRDKYGRLLAYVYLVDGTFLNAEIIKQGYGFAYTKYPFKYLEGFRRHEREAREKKRGLWGE